VLYSEDKDIPKNPEAALSWFLKAAEQGHPKAQAAVGSAHLMGNGAEQDLMQALMWYQLSANGGDENGAKLTQSLQGQLDDEKRAEVAKLVQEWSAAHPNVRAGS
jgi:hypothetical protein